MPARLIQLIIFCCFGSPFLLIAQPADFAEIDKLVASDSEAGGNFGQAVAIETPWLLIGAPGETEDVIGANSLPQAGAAYFYRLDSISGEWQEFQKVVPQDREDGDRFGSAVAIQDSMALISAIWEDDGLPGDTALGQAGAVYVFRLHPNGVWQQHQKLVPSDRKGYDYFGCALAMDGPYAVIGAYGRDPGGIGQAEAVTAGQAYVFERDSNGTWATKR
ncbi:MAG: FG-GAP repeat protein [Bacteroidota bacterium]